MKIKDGWLDIASQGSYGAKSSSRESHKPRYIVLHGTAGGTSAAGIDNYFTSGLDQQGRPVQASSHFIIDQQGVITQGISLDRAAWANCCLKGNYASFLDPSINQNLYTISIEHVKSSKTNSDILTPIQAQKSFELIACLCNAYGIPKRAGDAQGGIISHADIDPVSRERCPGPYPWDALWAFLKGENTLLQYGPGMGDFDTWFNDLGDGSWRRKDNGVIVFGSNLELYKQLSIDGKALPVIGLPLESEQYHQDPDGYSWSTQRCERAQMVYDPEHRHGSQPGMGASYLRHLSEGIVVLQQYVSALEARVQSQEAVIEAVREVVR